MRTLLKQAISLVVVAAALSCASDSSAPLDRIPDGNWGGPGIGLFVDQTGVALLFDCAGGRVDQPVALDANGDFDVMGTFSDAGNIFGADHSPHPARYTGHVTPTQIDLARTILDRVDTATRFRAVFGVAPMVIAC